MDLDRRATEIAQDAAEVGVESGAEVVGEQALAVLRAEDEMDVDFGERLGAWRRQGRFPALLQSAAE